MISDMGKLIIYKNNICIEHCHSIGCDSEEIDGRVSMMDDSPRSDRKGK